MGAEFDPEEDEPTLEAAWPHLQVRFGPLIQKCDWFAIQCSIFDRLTRFIKTRVTHKSDMDILLKGIDDYWLTWDGSKGWLKNSMMVKIKIKKFSLIVVLKITCKFCLCKPFLVNIHVYCLFFAACVWLFPPFPGIARFSSKCGKEVHRSEIRYAGMYSYMAKFLLAIN